MLLLLRALPSCCAAATRRSSWCAPAVAGYPPAGITLSALSPLTTIIAAATAQQAAPQQPAAPAPAAGPISRKLLQQQAVQPAAEQQEAKAVPQPAVLLEPIYEITEDGSSGSGSSAVATSYGDALEAASAGGDLAAYNLLAANQELMCTGSVSGALLAGLVGGPSTTSSVAAAALFDQLAQDLLQGEPALGECPACWPPVPAHPMHSACMQAGMT